MPPGKDDANHSSVNRRAFFRRIFLQGLDQVEKRGQQLARAVGSSIKTPAPGNPGSPTHLPITRLRPPGAILEPDFAATCTRCDECVKACPADCIVRHDALDDGLPHIVARAGACVVCDELACMKACPSGALQLVEQVSQINMGLAVMNFQSCLRQPAGRGEDCRVCVDHCPLGEAALGIDDAGRVQVRQGCIGCGVCEWSCPTQPASIRIVPPTMSHLGYPSDEEDDDDRG